MKDAKFNLSVGVAFSHEYRDLKSLPQNKVIPIYCELFLIESGYSLKAGRSPYL